MRLVCPIGIEQSCLPQVDLGSTDLEGGEFEEYEFTASAGRLPAAHLP